MKNFNSVFIGTNIEYVYSESQRKEIEAISNLYPKILTADTFRDEDLSEIEVIFSTWGMPRFEDSDFAKMPNLKAVFYGAGATEGFALSFLERNILVSSAWVANAIPVAEFTVAQIILSLKNYFSPQVFVNNPLDWKRNHVGPGCYGETVALLGTGAVAQKVKELLKPYNLKVLMIPFEKEKQDISIEEAFQTAYVVSNHLPNRSDSKHIFTRNMFASMRQGATFINTGRGAQVDEAGLVEVMEQRGDLTALLDVTDPEPPVQDSPLYTTRNIRITPHIAGSLNDEVNRMADYMIEEYKRFASGADLQYPVIKELLLS